LGIWTTNSARYAPEITSRMAMAKSAFTEETLLKRKLDLNLRKILLKCYILNKALCSPETWTLRGREIRNTWQVLNVVLDRVLEQ
jgi:hypothetical protein